MKSPWSLLAIPVAVGSICFVRSLAEELGRLAAADWHARHAGWLRRVVARTYTRTAGLIDPYHSREWRSELSVIQTELGEDGVAVSLSWLRGAVCTATQGVCLRAWALAIFLTNGWSDNWDDDEPFLPAGVVGLGCAVMLGASAAVFGAETWRPLTGVVGVAGTFFAVFCLAFGADAVRRAVARPVTSHYSSDRPAWQEAVITTVLGFVAIVPLAVTIVFLLWDPGYLAPWIAALSFTGMTGVLLGHAISEWPKGGLLAVLRWRHRRLPDWPERPAASRNEIPRR